MRAQWTALLALLLPLGVTGCPALLSDDWRIVVGDGSVEDAGSLDSDGASDATATLMSEGSSPTSDASGDEIPLGAPEASVPNEAAADEAAPDAPSMEASPPLEATAPIEASVPIDAASPMEGAAPIAELPGIFVFGAPSSTPTRGSSGAASAALCPGSQVATGYAATVNTGQLVSSLQLFCSQIDVAPPAPYSLRWSTGATLPAQGLPSGPVMTATCPPGQAIVGVHGRSGDFVDQVGFECAPLTRQSDGSVSVSFATPTVLPGFGGNGGGSFDDPCPNGEVVRGWNVSGGAWLDSVSAVCAPPTAPPCVQDLSQVSTGTFRVSFVVQTTQAGLVSLVNQRDVCNIGFSFWDVRLSNGNVAAETDDGLANYTRVTSSGATVDDGSAHTVLVERQQGILSVMVDGALVGSGASISNLVGLPPLALRQDPQAISSTGTVPLAGMLTNLCVVAR